jgi:hypothetical protein
VEDEFVAAAPRILGALLTAVSIGLGRLGSMELPGDLPRMAAFAAWVAACEPGFGWKEGTFRKAYDANLLTVANTVVEADPVAEAIIKWAEPFPEGASVWTGYAEEALKLIGGIAGAKVQERKDWPRSARGMGHRFRTLAPVLMKFGIKIEILERNHGRAKWTISREAAP